MVFFVSMWTRYLNLNLSFLGCTSSINHDKIQKWYSWERYYLATNTFPMVERTFSLLPLGRYVCCDWPPWEDIYPVVVINTKSSFTFSYGKVAYLSPDKGNDWLNSVNLENVFWENYILLFTTYDKCNQKICFTE